LSDIKVILPTKDESENPSDYVNNKLVPIVSELHRLTNALICGGNSEEYSDIDMIPSTIGLKFAPVDVYLQQKRPKSCTFEVPDNTPYQQLGKSLKALFKAEVYSEKGHSVCFRLINSNSGESLRDSSLQVMTKEPKVYSVYLPIGAQKDRVQLNLTTYHIEAKCMTIIDRPICRRFSLSLVYV
jgi:hypothetical protein